MLSFYVEQFMSTILDNFGKVCDNKLLFVCGDFKIDLLKWSEHKLTTDFCNEMFSFGLRPLTDKPSRITKNVPHFFTTSGLLLSDISYHLPIFVILKRAFLSSSK